MPGLVDGMNGMKAVLRKLWRDFSLPMIVDASALDWLAPHSFAKDLIRVVTPHPGEAAQMLNSTPQKVQADRVGSIARNLKTIWQLLGRVERPSNFGWPRRG